jgi:hypothetical protein
MWRREEWRTRGDDLRTFLADFVSFLSQLRRWIKSTACSGAIEDVRLRDAIRTLAQETPNSVN